MPLEPPHIVTANSDCEWFLFSWKRLFTGFTMLMQRIGENWLILSSKKGIETSKWSSLTSEEQVGDVVELACREDDRGGARGAVPPSFHYSGKVDVRVAVWSVHTTCVRPVSACRQKDKACRQHTLIDRSSGATLPATSRRRSLSGI